MVFSDRRPGYTRIAEDPRTPIAPVARDDSREDRRSTRRSAIAMLIGGGFFIIFGGRSLELIPFIPYLKEGDFWYEKLNSNILQQKLCKK
ncbi:MAG: hypothetical protein ACXAEI_01415 [Candidatus Hodarchaeales archaeon]|jgi:hypothetical protein